MENASIIPATERELKNHVGFGQTIRDSLTMAYRGILKVRRTPELFADVVLQPIIFTVMFTYLFGGAIAGSIADYLPYIIPGILAQTVITASTVTGTQLRDDMNKGVFDRFKSLPIARIAPLAGALISDVLRYVVATTITIVMGLIMGMRPEGGFWGVALAGVLVIFVAWAISWIFAFLGVMARNTSSVQMISFLVLFPLTFLSNAFVKTDTLPSFLQWFANINPVSHMISAVRELMNSATIGVDFWWTLLGAVVVVLVFAPLAVRAYMRKA